MSLTLLSPLPDYAPHILLVDDDARIRTLMSRYLQGQGFRVSTAAQTIDARTLLEVFVFDALVLDVMMPGETGMDFARTLRQHPSPPPILMLTARGDVNDRIEGLEAGVDDYMSKPFEPRELLLRLQALLRRTQAPATPKTPDSVTFGAFVYDLRKGELHRDGISIRITERERDILRILSERGGEVVSRQELTGGTGGDAAVSDRAVDVQINRLRRKIEQDPGLPDLLQTVRGGGYRLMVD